MPKTEQPAGEPIVLTVGTIIAGQHYPAGKPLPYVNEADVPRTLRPFIARGPPEPPEELQGIFELNRVYMVDEDGHRGRAVRRHAGQLDDIAGAYVLWTRFCARNRESDKCTMRQILD